MRTPLLLTALLLAGCAGAPGGPDGAVCPAIGWTNGLRVELAGDWGEPAPASVRVACAGGCGQVVREDADPVPRAEVVAEVTGSTAGVPVDMTTPDSAVVTVLAADGTVLAEEERDLDWVRVGGSAACGGPMEAAVEVAAP
ncbi:hypothetical protein ACI78R_15140 [Geodermatophilus sp. SYSU D01106]